MTSDFETKFMDLANEINVELTNEETEKFYNYMKQLLEWNKKINLTAITEEDEIILKHFIDSLTVMKYINDGDKIIDVGTGAGFPGIPISITNPSTSVTLLDSLKKRITFLETVKEENKIHNIKCVHGRAEDIGQNKLYREKYDVSVSRAVANLSTLVEYLIPMIRVGGKCICMKATDTDEEIRKAKFAIKELGGKIIKVDKFLLPNSDMQRTIIIIEKVKDTPKKFPRKAGTPSREPLK